MLSMPNLINFIEKKVFAKGINKYQTINQEKVKSYFFDDEYNNFKHLENIKLKIKSNPILFYPGSGSDILTPLFYMEKFFPYINNMKLIFMDKNHNLRLIKTILDDVGVHFSQQNSSLKFFWRNMLVHFEYIQNNVFAMNLPTFDIYFEKSFRIIRDQDFEYENKIFNQLNDNGILISDSGFESFPFKKVDVPKNLSVYGEMIVGIKIT
jgi:hypothetical protein